jgi:hypothetical protein
MSQWRCDQCGAIRAVPHRFIVRGDGALLGVIAKPCKRCGSRQQPSCDFDPWLDIAEDGESPSLAGKVAA